MNPDEIKQLIDLMNQNDLLELEVVEEGKKVRLKKMYEGGTRIVPMPMTAVPAAVGSAAGLTASAPTPVASGATRAFIKSPMVGTFYRAASPESPNYVEIGSAVTPDTVICMLEAMKVFNEIKSEMSGKVVDILVENGEAVEYGQPLVAIELAS